AGTAHPVSSGESPPLRRVAELATHLAGPHRSRHHDRTRSGIAKPPEACGMRLVLKLTLAIVAGMCAVLAIHGYLQVQREVGLNRADMQSDHYAMGRAFGTAVAEVWRVEGEERAMQLVKELNEREQLVLIRWVWLASPASDLHRPQVVSEQLREVG